MIVSHRHRYIFIHVWRSGGTSVTKALEPFERQGIGAALGRLVGGKPFGKHAYAVDVRERLGHETWDAYFKFAFVRNPFDWLASWYKLVTTVKVSPDTGQPWRHALHDVVSPMSYPEYLRWVVEQDGLCTIPARRKSSLRDRRPFLQRDWIDDPEGNRIVDFVGRYENLAEDFATIGQRIGLPGLELGHVAGTGGNTAAARVERYDDAMRRQVEEYFAGDLEAFGYRFDT